jgi:hypothetical protein
MKVSVFLVCNMYGTFCIYQAVAQAILTWWVLSASSGSPKQLMSQLGLQVVQGMLKLVAQAVVNT